MAELRIDLPIPMVYLHAMRLYWTHIWRSRRYQHGTFAERRLLELRYSLARALRARRREKRMTQAGLAKLIGAAPSTISHIERASMRVALEQVIFAMLALEFSDAEIGAAFDAGARKDVRWIRERAARRLARRPSEGFRRAQRVIASVHLRSPRLV